MKNAKLKILNKTARYCILQRDALKQVYVSVSRWCVSMRDGQECHQTVM